MRLKQAWVRALRSGDYEKGEGCLLRGGKHCCLGVLCEVAGMPKKEGGDYVYFLYDRFANGAGLGPAPRRDLGLTEGAHKRLVTMNDLENRTFEEIADWIEDNL